MQRHIHFLPKNRPIYGFPFSKIELKPKKSIESCKKDIGNQS